MLLQPACHQPAADAPASVAGAARVCWRASGAQCFRPSVLDEQVEPIEVYGHAGLLEPRCWLVGIGVRVGVRVRVRVGARLGIRVRVGFRVRVGVNWLGIGLGLGLGLGSGSGLGGLLEQRHVSGPAALHDSGHVAGGELQLG